MDGNFIFTDYFDYAMTLAKYEELEDGMWAATIPGLSGVIGFADTYKDCEIELRSVLEDWVLIGFRLGHTIPALGIHDLHRVYVHSDDN